MKYSNPNYKKIRQSQPMIIACGPCKQELVRYQKVGRGNLRRLHLERVIDSNIPLGLEPDLQCPACGTVLGHLIELDGKSAYRMIRSLYNMTLDQT